MIKQPPQQASTRVAFNTMILYLKVLLTGGISLYSVRLVLYALGASDFGIFSLIAGTTAMLSFLNSAMTTSTQRYLSFHQGIGDKEMQKKIFTNSWVLHIVVGIIVVGALLALAPFLFNGFLNIPADRISTAKTVYYFKSVSVFFTIISVPFTASLIARENMLWIAVVTIMESVLRLGIALSLVWFIQTERLAMYGLFMALLSIVTFLLYAVFCLKKYDECNVRSYRISKPLIKELGSFAGWNMFGAFSILGRTQGLAIILNVFLGTVINAAYGITIQIASTVFSFAQSMPRAIKPQIMQSEGKNDRQRMLRLSMMASKFGFFLLALMTIPIIFEMSAILELWLNNVPNYTVIFVSLFLIATLVKQTTIGLHAAILATGKIKAFQMIVGGIRLLNLPIAYLLLKLEFPPYSVLICVIATEFATCIFVLFLSKMKTGLSIKEYFERVILKEIIPLLSIIATCWIVTRYLETDFRFLITGMSSMAVFSFFVYFTGLCKDEKVLINSLLKKIIAKFYPKD